MDAIFNIGLIHYLVLSFLLFLIGLLGVLISRNMLRVLMSVFLMTVSVVLNFLTFGFYCDSSLANANIISVFLLIIAIVQTAIGLVILYKINQSNEFLDSEKIRSRKIRDKE